MARIRTIKPEFFTDVKLQELQESHPELNPMLTFAGLWCQCDRNGNFKWCEKSLHHQILPFLTYDFTASLLLLEEAKLITKYLVNDTIYGSVVTWHKNQYISGKEATSAAKYPEKLTTRPPRQHRPDPDTTRIRPGYDPESHKLKLKLKLKLKPETAETAVQKQSFLKQPKQPTANSQEQPTVTLQRLLDYPGWIDNYALINAYDPEEFHLYVEQWIKRRRYKIKTQHTADEFRKLITRTYEAGRTT